MISAIMQGGSPCENAPNLRLDTFNLDIGAMMAPRPMLMVAATGDWTRNTPREEYPAMRAVYELNELEHLWRQKEICRMYVYRKEWSVCERG